jgi:hypothetical protein
MHEALGSIPSIKKTKTTLQQHTPRLGLLDSSWRAGHYHITAVTDVLKAKNK